MNEKIKVKDLARSDQPQPAVETLTNAAITETDSGL